MKDLFSLIDTNFKKEIMKILKELRKVMDRNAEYCRNELEIQRKTKKNKKAYLQRQKLS